MTALPNFPRPDLVSQGLSQGPVWDDLVAELQDRGHPTAPAFSLWDPNSKFRAREFTQTDGATNNLWAVFHPDHKVRQGTLYYPHIHLVVAGNVSGTVRFVIDWAAAERDGVFTYDSFNLDCVIDTTADAATVRRHLVFECSDGQAIPFHDVDSNIEITVYRDSAVGGNLAASVWSTKFDLHYQCDENYAAGTPSKAAPFRVLPS